VRSGHENLGYQGKGGALVATLRHDDDASKKGSPKAGFILARCMSWTSRRN
jgi:hypothetical protein